MEDLLNARIKPADKKGSLSYLSKYQWIYRMSIILYPYTYRIEKVDQHPALLFCNFTTRVELIKVTLLYDSILLKLMTLNNILPQNNYKF